MRRGREWRGQPRSREGIRSGSEKLYSNPGACHANGLTGERRRNPTTPIVTNQRQGSRMRFSGVAEHAKDGFGLPSSTTWRPLASILSLLEILLIVIHYVRT
jgi:hypothetical protein